jgi:hypothetical protein
MLLKLFIFRPTYSQSVIFVDRPVTFRLFLTELISHGDDGGLPSINLIDLPSLYQRADYAFIFAMLITHHSTWVVSFVA